MESTPSYLQPNHPYHSPSIIALVDTWTAIFEKKIIYNDTSCKQAALAYLKGHHKGLWLSDNQQNQIAVMLNTCISQEDWNRFVWANTGVPTFNIERHITCRKLK